MKIDGPIPGPELGLFPRIDQIAQTRLTNRRCCPHLLPRSQALPPVLPGSFTQSR